MFGVEDLGFGAHGVHVAICQVWPHPLQIVTSRYSGRCTNAPDMPLVLRGAQPELLAPNPKP